ncbi:hypothetical protein A9Q81_24625 [Gammaproteobacteria bacterium 42_54_T18]|nr:hypothetical protein A9Q81_24625 [Gammaproteobacteria bacterium 42_54_T18]
MKLKLLNMAITAGLLSVSGFSHLAYADLVSTAACQAANTATAGSCLTVAEWHNSNDTFGGVKKATFADDLFLVVSKSGTYNKAGTYEMLPGYHWATQAEWEARFDPYKAANGTDGLTAYNYYNLGGWVKYVFEGVERRDFLYADSSVTAKTVYVGHREKDSIRAAGASHETHPAYAASDPATTVDLWAGFVLIKDPVIIDDDGDGVANADDAFPNDISASVDTDSDGKPDDFNANCDASCTAASSLVVDTDDDNDGYSDIDEAAAGTDSLDVTAIPADNDGDFISDVTDPDDDNDGVIDSEDDFPFDDTKSERLGPDITVPADITVAATNSDGTSAADESIIAFLATTAIDAEDGSVNVTHDAPDIFPIGPTTVTFSATNQAGVEETVQAVITIADQTAPTLTIVGESEITITLNDDYTEAGFSATDNVDGDISANVVVAGDTVDTSVIKSYTVTYNVSDAAGNVSEVTRLITVQPGAATTVPVAQWHNIGGEFGGLKKVGFADDLFLAVSDSGNYIKANTYEMIPGYRWATFEEMETRLNAYIEANGTDNLKVFNYHNLGGWDKYEFPNKAGEVVERRNFTFANSHINERVVYAGVKEYLNLTYEKTYNTDYSDDSILGVSLWAGFVLVKGEGDPDVPAPEEQNVAPTVSLSVAQNSRTTSIIDSQAGIVTVTAAINDVNSLDNHTVTWNVGSTPLLDLNNDDNENTFEFDTSLLDAGSYTLMVDVSENNTSDTFSVSVDVNLVIEATLTTLSNETDTDNDGTSDADEGYGDTDQDGIADYLDDDSNTTRLPIGTEQKLQTVNGLVLSLGDIVRSSEGATSADASISIDDISTNGGENGSEIDNAVDANFAAVSNIINFNVSGLSKAGETVAVVIPLDNGTSIPELAIYRKYIAADGWFSFIEDENNSIKSALKDEQGNCPAPLDSSYVDGLIKANDCIQLMIEDGGANDADGLANAVVKDPGVLATANNQPPTVVVETAYTVNGATEFSIDASATTDAENDTLSYLWTQSSGTTVTLVGADSAILSFTTPSVDATEELTFQLVVSDGISNSLANVKVTVTQANDAPTVSIEQHAAAYDEAAYVALTTLSADANGDDISYQWLQVSGPVVAIDDSTAANISFLAPLVSADATLEFKVTVSDGVDSSSATTSLTVKQRAAKKSSGGSMGWMLALITFGALRRKLLNKPVKSL